MTRAGECAGGIVPVGRPGRLAGSLRARSGAATPARDNVQVGRDNVGADPVVHTDPVVPIAPTANLNPWGSRGLLAGGLASARAARERASTSPSTGVNLDAEQLITPGSARGCPWGCPWGSPVAEDSRRRPDSGRVGRSWCPTRSRKEQGARAGRGMVRISLIPTTPGLDAPAAANKARGAGSGGVGATGRVQHPERFTPAAAGGAPGVFEHPPTGARDAHARRRLWTPPERPRASGRGAHRPGGLSGSAGALAADVSADVSRRVHGRGVTLGVGSNRSTGWASPTARGRTSRLRPRRAGPRGRPRRAARHRPRVGPSCAAENDGATLGRGAPGRAQ